MRNLFIYEVKIPRRSPSGDLTRNDNFEKSKFIREKSRKDNFMKRTFYFFVIINCLILSIAFAGNTGGLRGRIVDKSTKQPLAGANIEILETVKGAATDLEGYFSIELLDENIYKLQISYIGYESLVIPDVRIIRSKKTYLAEIELAREAMEEKPLPLPQALFRAMKSSQFHSQNIQLRKSGVHRVLAAIYSGLWKYYPA